MLQKFDFKKYKIGMSRSEICLLDHNTIWSRCFEEVTKIMQKKFKELKISFHHIGSTSIKDISAKPIIDILGTVDKIEELDSHKNILESLGFTCKGEYGITGRRFSVLYNGDETASYINLHVFSKSNSEVSRHLAFKDYLNNHLSSAQEYNNLKHSLAKIHRTDRIKYTDSKSDLIQSILKLAKLNNGSISLWPFTKELAKLWFKWRNEPNLVAYNPVLNLSVEQLEERITKESTDLSKVYEEYSFRWIIKYDDTFVGTVALTDINPTMKYAEIGYGIGEEYQGKGLGQKAVKAMIDKVFKETDLRRLVAHVYDKNIASCRLLENLGFKKEGLLRNHYIINGIPANECVYGLLREEYR